MHMPNEKDELTKEDKERITNREKTASRYEEIFHHLSNADRSGDDRYSQADIWRLADMAGKITDIDVGFVIALERLAFKVSYLEDRLIELESKRKA